MRDEALIDKTLPSVPQGPLGWSPGGLTLRGWDVMQKQGKVWPFNIGLNRDRHGCFCWGRFLFRDQGAGGRGDAAEVSGDPDKTYNPARDKILQTLQEPQLHRTWGPLGIWAVGKGLRG